MPRDLSVIGFDGIALGEDLTPALSTMTQPNSDIGRHSVELLVQALAGGTGAERRSEPAAAACAFASANRCAPIP